MFLDLQASIFRIGGGGSEFILVMYLGVENKNPLGQGGGHIFHQVFGGWGGSDVFHWFLLSLKVKAPQTPHIPNDTANNIKYSK